MVRNVFNNQYIVNDQINVLYLCFNTRMDSSEKIFIDTLADCERLEAQAR
jgi:hypothetical protein